MDAEHVDKTHKNNPNAQPGPELNKSNDENPSWGDGESEDTGTDSIPAALCIMGVGSIMVCYCLKETNQLHASLSLKAGFGTSFSNNQMSYFTNQLKKHKVIVDTDLKYGILNSYPQP